MLMEQDEFNIQSTEDISSWKKIPEVAGGVVEALIAKHP